MTSAARPSPTASAWHALPAAECAALLDADLAAGLAPAEAARRLARNGPNALPEPPRTSALRAFLGQFASILVALLGAAGLAMALMGEFTDAAAILAILVVNAVLGFVQERRASDALAALRRMTAPSARVRRGGATEVVPAAALVTGDVVVIEAGDRIPADVRLVRTNALRTVESTLTGESDAVEKEAANLAPAAAPVADRAGMAWTGTTAAAGDAEGLVVATGPDTEFGRIAALVQSSEEPDTPLELRLRSFGRVLTIACGAVVLLVFGLGLLRGIPAFDMLLTSVSLAVAAVPEGLTAVVTIALALGVSRMAKRNALVRRLPAVETLGCTTVICSDKTGTLTLGEMTLREVVSGGAAADDADVLRAGAACSTARLVEKEGRTVVAGDPTEGAILLAARKAGLTAEQIDAEEPAAFGIPFDAARRRMSVVRRRAGGLRSYVKGAPESVLPQCVEAMEGGRAVPLDDERRRAFDARNLEMAARGLRVLAVARSDFAQTRDPGAAGEEGLTLLGLVGLHDPPRDAARAAVKACTDAGIRVVMITGDQPATALAIARDLGIATDASEVMAGADIERTTDEVLRGRVDSVAVYARASPEHKLRIVRAWQARGAVVAMTGDGVNDAPALKGADIGVAMGRTGTDVAKDASAMVITDDDFASIVAAVEEGRRIFENIRKTLLFLLSGNIAELLVMTVAVAAGWPLPLVPIQLLWINLVTDGLPALALASDPADPDVLRRPPRPPGSEIADRGFLSQMGVAAVLSASVTLAGFLYGLNVEGSLERARTYAFSILVMEEVLRSFAMRSPTRTLWEVGALSNVRLAAVVAATVALQLWSHHSGALESFLKTGELTFTESAMTLALAAVPVTLLELAKIVRRVFARETSP